MRARQLYERMCFLWVVTPCRVVKRDADDADVYESTLKMDAACSSETRYPLQDYTV
jgi:hypothetical protein